jgi:hypothetical protein
MKSILAMDRKRSILLGLTIWGTISLCLNAVNLFIQYYWPFFSGVYVWILGLIMLISDTILHFSYNGIFILGTIIVIIIDSLLVD